MHERARTLLDSITRRRHRAVTRLASAALLTLTLGVFVLPAQSPSVAPGPSSIAPPDGPAFARAADYAQSTGAQAVLVMYRGKVIFERYFAGGDVGRAQLLASGSKSFVGVATIAAVADGFVRLDQPVAELLPEWRTDTRKSRVTVRQLLSLESGLDPGSPGTGCGGPRATWNDAIAADAQAEPGVRFAYGPYPFVAMGAALERAHPSESFDAYLERRILRPLGITVDWRLRCADGKPQLAGGASTTARDWAVFGDFIRRGGAHNGQRVIPDSLVAQLFRPSRANSGYGMSWWLREAADETEPTRGASSRRRTGGGPPAWLPADLVMAAGAGKQRLYVIPSRELVIVRMGPVLGGFRFQDELFLEPLLAPASRPTTSLPVRPRFQPGVAAQ